MLRVTKPVRALELMQHDGLSTSMGGLWRNLDAMATTDPAGGFRTAEYTRSALIRRINLVGYRKRYFVMQLGLRLLATEHYQPANGRWDFYVVSESSLFGHRMLV